MKPDFHTTAVGVVTVIAVLAAAPAASQHQTVTLLHTSDLHGSVLPWDDFRNRPADGSLAQISTLVKRIRSSSTHPVLLFDSGDTIQGTPLEQFTNARWGLPSPTVSVMNDIGYDAAAIGNHEFNFGLEVLGRVRDQAVFPMLSANTVNAVTGAPAFPGHVVMETGGLKVGVFGVTTPNIPGWERPEHYRGLAFRPPDEVAREQVERLRGQKGCDVVVALAHTGFERDLEDGSPTGLEAEDWAWRLARVPGIDVLLTGHTHENIPPRLAGDTIVAQPGARARLLTRIDLELERDGDRWRVADWSGENLPVAGIEADPEITAAMTEQHQRVVEALDGPVGAVGQPVSVAGCRLRDCTALDLIHQVQLVSSGAELSLASLLSDRTPDLPAGPVTWRWVYAFYVYPNTLTAVEVTGAQVVDILEHAARYYRGLECSPEGACEVITDGSIPHYNVDSMAGVSYRIDPTRPAGQRVRDVRVAGRPIDRERVFRLVCNNYRAAGGGGFPHLAEAEVVWQSSEEMTDLIGDHISAAGTFQPTTDVNWHLGPTVAQEREVDHP